MLYVWAVYGRREGKRLCCANDLQAADVRITGLSQTSEKGFYSSHPWGGHRRKSQRLRLIKRQTPSIVRESPWEPWHWSNTVLKGRASQRRARRVQVRRRADRSAATWTTRGGGGWPSASWAAGREGLKHRWWIWGKRSVRFPGNSEHRRETWANESLIFHPPSYLFCTLTAGPRKKKRKKERKKERNEQLQRGVWWENN